MLTGRIWWFPLLTQQRRPLSLSGVRGGSLSSGFAETMGSACKNQVPVWFLAILVAAAVMSSFRSWKIHGCFN